jgi:iron(III) transport system permease protein
MDPALDEASRSLGRSRWRTFRTVTLPLLRPSLAAGMLLTGLYTLSDFGAVSLLRYETFTWTIFLQYQTAFDRSIAATLSVGLIALAVGLLWMESRTRGRAAYHRVTGGSPRPAGRIPLGRWRWAAFAFCALVVLVSLALPIGVLAYWALRGILAGQTVAVFWSAAWNSVYVSLLAAAAALAAGLPVAILLARHRGKLSAFVDKAAHVGFGLPGIVIALALVFFVTNIATPLYQSMALLVFAYATLFLAAALGPLQATLREVNPRLEEAARGLGRTPPRVFLGVTLPLMRPGVLAAGALVFLLTMKELPATLLLSPLGFDTLATAIWSAASEAYFAQAAAPALLLVAVSAIPMAILTLRGWKQ